MQYRIGIDLGGTAVKSGIVDENHQVVFRHSQPSDHNFERAVAGLAEAVEVLPWGYLDGEEMQQESESPPCKNRKNTKTRLPAQTGGRAFYFV